MKSDPIPAALFIRNRKKLAGKLKPGSLVVVCSAGPMPRNGDQFFPYRQQSDFFYLTGINQEGSVLVLSPGSKDTDLKEVLFIRKPDAKSELWSGPWLSCEGAIALSGIPEVKWLEELDPYLSLMLKGTSSAYFNHAENTADNSRIKSPDTVLYEKISKENKELVISRLGPILMELRMVKEYEEVEEIRKAAEITRLAFIRAIQKISPGVWEYEVESEITAEFLSRGAEGHAYEPIVASGRNALILHYLQNNSRCVEGEMLLMDFGAEVNNYGADCTRTIPVNGRFSNRQLDVYNAVLRVFRQAREMMVTGTKIKEFNLQVGSLWEEEHLKLGLYTKKEIENQNSSEPMWKKYFVHGTSHSLGLDVHDPFDRTVAFKPGMVLTCEPAIYLPEEDMGIRLENDILITEDGPVDLLERIPIEAEEIEDIMNT